MKIVKITSVNKATHNAVCIKTEKPASIDYATEQAVDLALNILEMKNELRVFTFTSTINR
ncbi:MAG: hypothetical protein J5I47_12285 [Vicingus serpentipes]|nr:hypothetical protein [Vicingus serpentipes]